MNQAYQTLSDDTKRKQYDMFGETWGAWNPFAGQSWWYSQADFWWFEDIFSQFWWSSRNKQSQWFDFSDLFGNMWWWTQSSYGPQDQAQKPVSLDFEKTYEVPIFDMILGCKIEVSWVYGQKAKLTIPAGTKPGAKLRVKEFWKSEGSKKWHLIVVIKALMPKNISDVDASMLERIRDNVWY